MAPDPIADLLAWYFYGSLFGGTASPAELCWTLAALLGVLLNVRAGWDAHVDLRYLARERLNGARQLVARGHRRNAIVRGLVKSVFLWVGLAAMVNPPPTARGNSTTYLAGTTFILAVAGLTWLDVRERAERRALLAMLARPRDGIPDDAGGGA